MFDRKSSLGATLQTVCALGDVCQVRLAREEETARSGSRRTRRKPQSVIRRHECVGASESDFNALSLSQWKCSQKGTLNFKVAYEGQLGDPAFFQLF
jgi:hypothetical protein